MEFHISEQAGTDESKAIQDQLKIYNHENIAPDRHKDLVISFKNNEGKVIAGLVGSTNWGWLFIRLLWVDDSLRGQGIGKQMIMKSLEIAKSRDCHSAWIDTFNPIALQSYQKMGFVVFGQLENFPSGKNRYFLKKRIS